MIYYFSLLILCITSALLSTLLTKLLIILLPKYGMLDVPSARRAHKKPTPRGAGIAFIIIFSLLLPAFEYLMFGKLNQTYIILEIFLPLSLISLWDDVSHVLISIRLLVHVICSFLAIMWLVHPNALFRFEIPIYLDLVIAAFALLNSINLYNFLDGIDGITVSETIHLSLTIIILCFFRYDIIVNADIILSTSTIILGWAAGFIYFNWQPAKIFLGDSGSITIGFLIGLCLITMSSSSYELFIACLIAPLYYILDGGLTILIRLYKGEKIWEPHLQHFFQKSVRNGYSHKEVVKRIVKCNLLLMVLSINALYYPLISLMCAFLTVSVTLIRSTYQKTL